MKFERSPGLPRFSLIFVLSCLAVTVNASVPKGPSVPIIPLNSAPLSASPAVSAADDGKPLSGAARAVAKRLQALTQGLHGPNAARFPGKAPAALSSLKNGGSLSNRKAGAGPGPATAGATPMPDAKLRMAWHRVGTPRWMRAESESVGSQGANGVLQKAVSGGGEATVEAFLKSYRRILRIANPDDELQLLSTETDELGRRHFRFTQRYRGLPVWPSGLTVHLDPKGNVDLFNGSHVPTPAKAPPEPILDGAAALQRARAALELPQAQAETSLLLWYAAVDTPTRLAWALELEGGADVRWRVVVDALNGRILSAYNTLEAVAAAGSGVDLFGQSRPLNIWQSGGSNWLVDTSKPMFIQGSDPLTNGRGIIQILDARNLPATNDPESQPLPRLLPISSSRPDSGWLPDAVSAAGNFSATYDYYRNRFARNSVDNRGSSIRAVVRLARNYANAFWSSDNKTMFFGDAQPYAGALDVVAHELTHGVTDYSARLEYLGQSGALNEAYSDIFGEMVERYATGGNDWLIGTQLGRAIRSLKDPETLSFETGSRYPGKMSEYFNIREDNGGVHINSSIINHAFYLLAEGLDDALGTTDSESIFFRALTVHLTAKSQFVDARLACIQAADELFGPGSRQSQRTAQAFDSVEIFERPPTPATAPVPAASGADAVVFLSYDPSVRAYRLARRETALNDGDFGRYLGFGGASVQGRPSVTADGRVALFVDDFNDICVISTNSSEGETCLGLNQVGVRVQSAAMAPDGRHFAYLLLDNQNTLEKTIYYYDAETRQAQQFDLVAPATEGASVDAIVTADAMDISLNNRYLVYDALNRLTLDDGSTIGAWSIYAYDLATGNRLAVVPPIPGQDIGNPAMGRSSSNLLVFESSDPSSQKTSIHAARLDSASQSAALAQFDTSDIQARPSLNGDDTAVVFSLPDGSAPTGASLWRVPFDRTQLTAGAAELFLSDGAFGTIYRRGGLSYVQVKKQGRGTGTVSSDFEGIDCGVSCSALYPPGTSVRFQALADYGTRFTGWAGACRGRRNPCTMQVGKREKVIRAMFRKLPTAVLQVRVDSPSGGGNVSSLPIGIDCGTSCRASFLKGARVELTAVPNPGSVFVGWSGACRGNGPCSLAVKGKRKLVARFAAQ